MSDVCPWIGFKRKEDRERFKQRIFWEYKDYVYLVAN